MVFIFSGPVHGGKSTFLERSLGRWASRGLLFCGFLSLAVTDEKGAKGYDLLELKKRLRLPYLRQGGKPGAERAGPFSFVPGTLDLARAIIQDADARELLVVDEVGPLELRGGGLWPALRDVVAEPGRRSLLVVREEILEDFVTALGPCVPLIFDVRDPNVQKLMDGSLFGTVKVDDGQG